MLTGRQPPRDELADKGNVLNRPLTPLGAIAAFVLFAAVPAPAFSDSPAGAADRDCADFDNQAKAQRFFIDQGGPERDPHRLDGSDPDGVACESLPCPCFGAKDRGGSESKPSRRAQTIRARVTKVVEGDTLRVLPLEQTKRSSYTVRLIGIDTPETGRPGTSVECGGPEASRNLTRLADGRRVVLRTDRTQDTFDRYDRLLAYAARRDGRQLQLAQLRAGWAKVYVYGSSPFRRVRAFRRAQRSARRADRGVWGECAGDFHHPARAAALAAKRRSCGTITSMSVYPFARVVAIRGVRCRRARRVARIYDHEGRSPGRWRCFLAHSDRPRLFSCGYPPTRGDIRRARHAFEAIGTRRRAHP
jgi:endonuclease YncB( thermonuclease family)